MPDQAEQHRIIRNEQLKLLATLFNNIAAAFIVTGFIVPIIALAYQTAIPRGQYWIAYALLWLATAGLNHQIARYLLARMDP